MNQASWMDGLADFLAESRGVEAILLNPEGRKVSIATLGNVDTELLKAKLDEVIRALDARFGGNGFHSSSVGGAADAGGFLQCRCDRCRGMIC